MREAFALMPQTIDPERCNAGLPTILEKSDIDRIYADAPIVCQADLDRELANAVVLVTDLDDSVAALDRLRKAARYLDECVSDPGTL